MSEFEVHCHKKWRALRWLKINNETKEDEPAVA